MPDKFGNLTRQEIDTLKQQVEDLRNLDKSFANREAIGQDVSDERANRDKVLAETLQIIKVYEPQVIE